MTYVVVASIIAVIVSLIYLGSVWRAFREVSRARRTPHPGGKSAHPAEAGVSALENESWFSWKLLISIILSTAVLIIAGQSASFWNLIPFIAIGSAIAIIVAFSIDSRQASNR
jgi:hypothetical protein